MATSVNRRGPKHKWSVEDRTLLSLLCRFCDWKHRKDHIRAVWNHLNHDQLLREGFPDGQLKPHSFAAQRGDYQNGKTGSDIWERVMRTELIALKEVFPIEMAMIKSAENELADVKLTTAQKARADEWSESEEEDDENATGWLYDERTHVQSSVNEANVVESSSKAHEVPTEAQDMTELLRRPLPRPYLRSHHVIGNYAVRCPVLLFRGFEPQHGLNARRFIDMELIPPPPSFQSPAYKAEVKPHLYRTIPYESPFLSLAQNPLNALKWVDKDNRDFAILLMQDVGDDAVSRYGDVGAAYPYLSHSVVHQHGLHDLPGGYTGRGEFLAWGSIECQPVAVYQNEDAISLRDTMKSINHISDLTGERLGPHLARISDAYKELVAYSFLRCFKVKGYERCPLCDDYDDFIATIYAVTHGDRAASVVSNVNPATLRASIPPTPQKEQQHEHADDEIEDESDLSNDRDSPESIQRSVYWEGVGTTSNGLRISRAGLSRSGKSDTSLASCTSPTQAAVDAQILGELSSYGFDVAQHTPPATTACLFTEQLLHQAAVPTPSPPAAPSIEVPDSQIIDLTSSDHDDFTNTPPSTASLSTPIKLDEEAEDAECIEVAFATRQPRSLSFRSKSLSEPIDTPTRVPKRKMAAR